MPVFRVSGWLVVAGALAIANQSVAQRIRPLSDFAKSIGSPALSPDGKTLAFEWEKPDLSWGIFLRPFGGGPFIHFAGGDPEEGVPTDPRWSPDGKQIAFLRLRCATCEHELFVSSYPRGGEQRLGKVCRSPVSWTPDGRFLIGTEPTRGSEECRIALIPVNGSSRIQLMASEVDIAGVSPDGKRLAYAVGNQLKLANLTPGQHIADVPANLAKEPHPISSINWLPDGRAFLYQVWSDGQYNSKLITMEGTASPGRLINAGGNIQISQILADGSGLGAEDSSHPALWRVDLQAATQEPHKVRSVPWTDWNLCVSPSGKWIAFATNRRGPTQIWVSRFDGSQPRVLVSAIPPFDVYGDRTNLDGISWSPDEKRIAFATERGVGHGVDVARLFLVPAAGGQLRVLVDLYSLDRDPPPWSADSRFVFISKEDENHETSFFQVDILSGVQTPVPYDRMPMPPRDLAPLPSRAEQPHLAQDGRFLYFRDYEQTGIRIVAVPNLVSDPAAHR
jgi:Tol biopolymer transport system component